MRSDGSSQINWIQGAIAANGTAAVLGVWNAYNRRYAEGLIGDTTDSWTYSGGVFRAANASNTMRASFVQGLQEDFFGGRYEAMANGGGASGLAIVSIGLNSTTTASGTRSFISAGAVALPVQASHRVQVLGFNFLQALENNLTATVTFYGDNGGAVVQTGMSYSGWF